MASLLGLRGTGDWGTDERPKNFRQTILWNEPNGMAPLLALMGRLGDESVDDPEFSWWEELLTLTKCTVNGALSSSATTIVVSSGALNLVQGDLLEVAVEHAAGTSAYAAEIVQVMANPTTDLSLVVSRGVAGTTAASISDAAVLVKIGSAFEEGSSAPRASTRNPTKYGNYTQIFKTTYEMTKTAEKTNVRTGDPVAMDKKRKMHDHSVALEQALLLGRKLETTGPNGNPLRYMGGLLSYLTTNNYVFSGTGTGTAGTDWNEDNFIAKLSRVFDYNSPSGDERLCFCGNSALIALNRLARTSSSTRINFNGVLKTYGMALSEWILPQGRLLVKNHPLFSQHPIFDEAMIVIAPGSLKYRYLRGRDTKFEDDIQAKGDDTRKGQWITEAGLEVHHEYTMGYFGNFGG